MQQNNILVLTYWGFKDALIQTYTLPYVKQIASITGGKVFLVCLQQSPNNFSKSELIVISQDLQKENIILINLNYEKFGLKMGLKWGYYLFKLALICFTKNITFIHTWCTPAGALGYILSTITQKPLILDSYEPHAEASVENGTWSKDGFAFRMLFWLEKKQSHHAKHFIAAAKSMKHYATEKYGITPLSIFVKPACVDLEKFKPQASKNKELLKAMRLENKIVCVYAGKFGGIYLAQEVFDFFKAAHDYWGDSFHILLLTNQSESSLRAFCEKSDLDFGIISSKFVPHSEVAQYMSLGDFGITPVKSVPTKQHCTPIKDGEYWALGLPVVITPHISDDSDIIEQNNIGAIWHYDKKGTYLDTIKKIDFLLKSQNKPVLQSKIRAIAEKYRNFGIAENIYKKIYTTV